MARIIMHSTWNQAVIPIILVLLLPVWTTPALAQRQLKVTITCDNAYMFGFGDADGISPGSLYGGVRNLASGEIYSDLIWDVAAHGGSLPPVFTHPYYGPERYTVNVDGTGTYLYIIAWSDNARYQGSIATFEDPLTGQRYVTGPESEWEVYATGHNLDPRETIMPTLEGVNTEIAIANNKAGVAPGSIGWVNQIGCSDGSAVCRGELVYCQQFTNNIFSQAPATGQIFGDAEFMWYHNPAFRVEVCDYPAYPPDSSGEYLIFRLGPLEKIVRQPCDSLLLNGALRCPDCCLYDITIENLGTQQIASVDYHISGGATSGVTATGACTLNTGASVILPQSGSLVFQSPCSSEFSLHFDTHPTINPGTVTIYLDVHLMDDTCNYCFTYTCDQTVVGTNPCCDEVEVISCMNDPEQLSERLFIVRNKRGVDNPIAFIEVDVLPDRCRANGWAGVAAPAGGPMVSIDFGWPFDRIPTSGNFSSIGYADEVQFRRGVEYSCDPVWDQGACTLTIHHKDGEICTFTYAPWVATPAMLVNDAVKVSPIIGHVYAGQLKLSAVTEQGMCCEKSITFTIVDPAFHFLTGTGGWLDPATMPTPARIVRHMQNGQETVFVLDNPLPLGNNAPVFELIVASDGAVSGPPDICWTTFDQNGNAVRMGCFNLSVATVRELGDSEDDRYAPGTFELLQFYPNPTTGMATIDFVIDKEQNIELTLFNNVGVSLRTIAQGWMRTGRHSLRFDIKDVPAGTYFLKLVSATGSRSKQITVVR